MESPQNRRFYFEVKKSFHLPHLYIDARRTTFAKAYGIKVRCYWERLGENVEIGNLLGTH